MAVGDTQVVCPQTDSRARLIRIEASIEAIRSDLTRFCTEHADHEARLRVIEPIVTTHTTKLAHLSKAVSTWNLGNSLGVAATAVLAWFK